MKIAVIPARGGSKRIPRKNVKLFAGKPIIAWSIDAARKSEIFDRIVLSTDDEEIASVGKQYGAEVPFLRPPEISDDFTGTKEVIAHAIQALQSQSSDSDVVCCIYATAPFLEPEDLKSGLTELMSGKWDYVFPVAEFNSSIFRSFKLDDQRRIDMVYPEHALTRSQDLPKCYYDAGQFYWAYAKTWLQGKAIIGNKSNAITIPSYRAQDIDTVSDWELAEIKFRAIQSIGQDK
jgi:pseudaminic acid cytidylyltransferase